MGHQFQDCDTITVKATAPLAEYTFVGYDGAPATSSGGGHDSIGITHTPAVAGEHVAVITEFSGLMTAAATIAKFDFVKPAADGSGKSIVGTATDHCGRALAAATAGQLFECQVLPHRHT
jgi:hypothetical protein